MFLKQKFDLALIDICGFQEMHYPASGKRYASYQVYEFENGLGVNCIDVLAEILLSERKDLQFIITSHHPKIINQISNKKWKIIERDIALVKNISAEEYGITHSQHDAYFNLIY